MIDRYRDAFAPHLPPPAAMSGRLPAPPRPVPGACATAIETRHPKCRCPGAAAKPRAVRLSTPSPPAPRRREARWRACCPAWCCWVAILVLWAGTALGQTMSITHTGSATVTNGRVQLVEGGGATTFQVDFEDDFLTNLKAAHPEAARSGTRMSGWIRITRSSADVTWDTTSSSTYKDRSNEFELSHNSTAIKMRYSNASTTSSLFTTRLNRLWFYLPLGSTPATYGQTPTTAPIDSYDLASFPITFSIKAKADTVNFEEDESITIYFRVFVSGTQATPTFTSFEVYESLTFDLVDGELPDPTGKPTTPANLTATAGRGAVTLAWDAIDIAATNLNRLNDAAITKHQYCQKTDTSACAATDWTDIPNSAYGKVNANTYTIGSLTNGTEYTFRVRAVNECAATTGCDISDAATAVMATPVADALAAPTGLMAIAGNTQVTLTWTDPGNDAILYYEYQQKKGQAPFGAWTEISGSSATTTSHRLTGLDNGTAYSYRIRAGTYPKPSPSSDAVTVTPRGAPPAAPVLSATARSGGVTLSWPNPLDYTIQSYEYQYRVGTAVWQPWQTAQVEDLYATVVQCPVGGLTNGAPHTFRIRAVNAQGATTSNEATATPVAGVPAKPTGLRTWVTTTSQGDRRILQWDGLADLSILRYEYTVDEGRTWALLASGATLRVCS